LIGAAFGAFGIMMKRKRDNFISGHDGKQWRILIFCVLLCPFKKKKEKNESDSALCFFVISWFNESKQQKPTRKKEQKEKKSQRETTKAPRI